MRSRCHSSLRPPFDIVRPAVAKKSLTVVEHQTRATWWREVRWYPSRIRRMVDSLRKQYRDSEDSVLATLGEKELASLQEWRDGTVPDRARR